MHLRSAPRHDNTENSHRTVLKATHTVIEIPREQPLHSLSRAVEKHGYMRALALQEGEVSRALREADPTNQVTVDALRTLEQYEARSTRAVAPDASVLAHIPVATFEALGKGLIALRQYEAECAPGNEDSSPRSPSTLAMRRSHAPIAGPSVAFSGTTLPGSPSTSMRVRGGSLVDPGAAPLQIAKDALKAFTGLMRVSPIGMLHLERIEITRVERGELLATFR